MLQFSRLLFQIAALFFFTSVRSWLEFSCSFKNAGFDFLVTSMVQFNLRVWCKEEIMRAENISHIQWPWYDISWLWQSNIWTTYNRAPAWLTSHRFSNIDSRKNFGGRFFGPSFHAKSYFTFFLFCFRETSPEREPACSFDPSEKVHRRCNLTIKLRM